MRSLDATYLVYGVLALPAVGAAVWSLYRQGAALLFDLLDADEMVVAAAHRLITAGYALLTLGLAVKLAPSAAQVHAGAVPAVFSSVAGLLVLLAVGHLGLLALYVRARNRKAERDFGPPRWYAGPVQIPGATPPIVPLPQPVYSPAPRGLAPPQPVIPAAARFAPPTARFAPPSYPPAPPPWCRPLPPHVDVWAPPRR